MAAPLDAIGLLKKDHALVKDLMNKIEKEKTVDDRTSMFEQLVDELSVHERIEEELFYPALKKHKDAKEDVLESFEEHHLVDEIIEGIDDIEPDDERWPAKFKTLKENVEHHIEEEETTLFPKAADLLGDEKLGELGVKMADLKEAEQQALAEQADEEEVEERTK
jgi:hemerythrin superfamily protein